MNYGKYRNIKNRSECAERQKGEGACRVKIDKLTVIAEYFLMCTATKLYTCKGACR